MARPHKQTVDYFPHDTDASEGKTLTIIQAKYGNDGYAFWFKLLQILGKSPGHYYNFNNPADWEFLLAKTHINDTNTAKGILGTLSLLGAIDSELYTCGYIWSDNFVKGVSDAYNRSLDGTPERPDFLVKESLRQIAGRLGFSESYLSQVTTGKRPPSKKLLEKCLSLGIDIMGVNVPTQMVNVLNSGDSVDSNPKISTEIQQTKRRLKDTKLNKTIYEHFETFWKAYPKKKSKVQAEKDFAKINPNEELLATMLASIELAKKSQDWQKDAGQFIPHPATWLNGRRWEDELSGGNDGKNRGNTQKGNAPKEHSSYARTYDGHP